MISVRLNNGRIVVSSPYSYKDILATVPSREWDARRALWKFMPTPHVASALVSRIEAHAERRGDRVDIADDVRALSHKAVNVDEFISTIMSHPAVAVPGSRHPPWKHQYIGTELIRRLDAVYLAWEMGTGKTKAVIDAILSLSEAEPIRVLIVCPTSVVSVWPSEIEKHVEGWKRRFTVAASQNRSVARRAREAEEALRIAEETARSAIIVTNYESFTLDGSKFRALAADTRWDILVADEADRLANPASKTAKTFCGILGPSAKRRVCLSGTPMRNSPLDIYSQCKFLDPGLFGTNVRQFLQRYAILDFFGNVVGLQNMDELGEKFGQIAYRVEKKSILDLPPVTVTTRRFDLCDEAARVYKEFEANLVAKVRNGEITASNAVVFLLRAQQLTSGYLPTVRPDTGIEQIEEIDDGKRCALSDIMDEVRQDEPIVVFCRFRHDLDAVRKIAAEHARTYYEISGRRNEVAAWRLDKSGAVLAVQIQAGGVGIDLTRSSYAVFYSVGFSLRDYEQAKARLDRPGQSRAVTIINIIARGTVDEAVFASIAAKKNVIESVLAYLKGETQ